jgi:hypothetical protein
VSDAALITIRVKSRTGDIYVRHARFFPHDKWATIEVPVDIANALAKDPWLDVRGLPAASGPAEVRDPEQALDRALASATARIEALEQELERVLAAHAQELERLRDTHARELEEARRRTEREIRDTERRDAACDAEPRPPARRSPDAQQAKR